jgi:hypothetical protein
LQVDGDGHEADADFRSKGCRSATSSAAGLQPCSSLGNCVGYLNWEFEPSPSDPFHLFLLMKDPKAMVGKR